MYNIGELKGMLFIDIETCSQYKTLSDLKENANKGLHDLWLKKAESIRKYEEGNSGFLDSELYEKFAPLHAEFGKINTISIGQISFDENGIPTNSKIKSFYGEDEVELLEEFNQTMHAIFSKNPSVKLVGHYIKNFDMPYIVRRSLVNGIITPRQFHFQKQKPWENCLIDTYEIWKFSGYSSSSLDLICNVLNIPSPKDGMKNHEVSENYWNGNIEEIMKYCEGDVRACMNVLLKISNMQII
jgi:DNA polymerase elongation subunit (family B)